jgi:hypothetical protein
MPVSAAWRSRSRASRVTSVRRTSRVALRLEAPVIAPQQRTCARQGEFYQARGRGACRLWPMPAFFHALAKSSLRPYNPNAAASCVRRGPDEESSIAPPYDSAICGRIAASHTQRVLLLRKITNCNRCKSLVFAIFFFWCTTTLASDFPLPSFKYRGLRCQESCEVCGRYE